MKQMGSQDAPLTVLITKTPGFVVMCKRLAASAIADFLSIYLEQLAESIVRHHGTVMKYTGDGVTGVWDHRTEPSEGTLLALRAAFEMVGRVDLINNRLRGEGFPMVRYGIAVTSGPAMAVRIGGPVYTQADVVGDTVNMAFQLAKLAGGMEILLDRATREMVTDGLETEDAGSMRITGRQQPVHVYRAVSLR